ncbi:hypothetical protein FACS189454_10140 [Planctomycetales bacterium]|nr:hypothetical protein FACS189454_10140 [Planctomycetales bacterium]
MKHIVLSLIVSFLFVSFANAEIRTWTSSGGKHKTEAEFIKISKDGKTVSLRMKDNVEINVALEKLSKYDQEYVKTRTKEDAKPNNPKSTTKEAERKEQPDTKSYLTDTVRRKIDLCNEDKGEVIVSLSENEKESIAHYLYLSMREERVKEVMLSGESYMHYLLESIANMKYYGMYQPSPVEVSKLEKKKIKQIDVYVVCVADYWAVLRGINNKSTRHTFLVEIEGLLPECNRLSGNAHDDSEKGRFDYKSREAEKKALFAE